MSKFSKFDGCRRLNLVSCGEYTASLVVCENNVKGAPNYCKRAEVESGTYYELNTLNHGVMTFDNGLELETAINKIEE